MLDCLLGWPTWKQVAVGIAGALLAGHLIVGGFHRCGQDRLLPKGKRIGLWKAVWEGWWCREPLPERYNPDKTPGSIPPCLTGIIERFIFTIVTVFDPGTAAVGMAGWLGLKMAAKWQRGAPNGQREDEWGSGAFLAALTGLISMFIAGVGGYFIRWTMGLPVLPT